AGPARPVRRRTRNARPATVVFTGVELDAQRLAADLGRGDPTEGRGGELTGYLDGGERVVDVDATEILAVEAAFGRDGADNPAWTHTVGVADGNAVALTDRIAPTGAATLRGATVP